MKIKEIEKQFSSDIVSVNTSTMLGEIRTKYLGKKGLLAELFGTISSIPPQEKKSFGEEVNALKDKITLAIDESDKIIRNSLKDEVDETFKRSLPGIKPNVGHLHVITQAIREITEIFKPLGFTQVRYPEIDWEYFAFEALNIPSTHPARDEFETFFIDTPPKSDLGRQVVTPHTSNGQVREMLKGNLPIRMLNISRCGRRQEDVSHNPTFFQFEGLVVDKGISIAHLIGVVDYFAKHFFSADRKIRLRPYDFRFTEPSFEIDVSCGLCGGNGCKFCKEGWVELGGAGMVHPNVLKSGKIDPSVYTGFAFGWGVERTYMMKSGTKLNDIRHLLSNDLKFLEQF
ncbi:MAG: phenylalanine--tRNA ligase subunit alpha [Microgenomates group bacterium]